MEGWLARFEIDASDLDELRRGRLSAKQAARVRRATGADWTFMAGLSVVASLVMGGVYALIATSPHAELAHELWLDLLIFALPGSAILWTLYTAWIHFRGSRAVDVHRGRVRKRVLRQRQLEICSIDVGDGWFDVARPIFEALEEDHEIRLYAVRGSRVVVMIEPV